MSMNSMIRLQAAQNQVLSEYPNAGNEEKLPYAFKSQELEARLLRYRNSLHQKFVVFHISETAASIESYTQANDELSGRLSHSRDAYGDTFVSLAEGLGDAVVKGVEGNYFSMLTQSVRAVVDFFQRDSALRNELHAELVKSIESGGTKKLQAFVDGDVSLDSYLSALRSDHFYFQSEVERLHHSGQTHLSDYQHAIAISTAWKDEIITAIVNLREYNFQQYAKITAESKRAQIEPYRDLATRIISEYLISPQQTGKIHSVSELDRLKIKFLNGRRDSCITDVINNDVSVRTEAGMQHRTISVDRYSLELKSLVATLKREVIANGGELINEGDDRLLSLLSEKLSLMMKTDLTEDERLTYYADYYFNKVEEHASADEELEKRLVPVYSFWDFKEDIDDKGILLYETLSHLGRDLLNDDIQVVSEAQVHKRLLLLQEKIQLVLNYYFMKFKKILLTSDKISISNEKKVDLFVISYLNKLLKQSSASNFYRSYFYGLVKFKAMLPQPNQIVLTEDSASQGQMKVLFLGGAFNQLNMLSGARKGWSKLRACAMFGAPKKRDCECQEESFSAVNQSS